jgi:hypothetical protein
MKVKSKPKLRIAIGYEFRTHGNQLRLVLFYTKDDKVVYAERGGGVLNLYEAHRVSSRKRFLAACCERLEKVSPKMLKRVIVSSHADRLIGK